MSESDKTLRNNYLQESNSLEDAWRRFAGQREPGYGVQDKVMPLAENPAIDMGFNAIGAMSKGATAYSILANAPWFLKPAAVVPGLWAANDAKNALSNYAQLSGSHPTQSYMRDWERQLQEAMRNGSSPFDFASRK